MSETRLETEWRYRLRDFKRINQTKVARRMIEDDSGESPTDPDKCILPPTHRHPLSYMRVGQISTPKEGGYRWRRYLWPVEGGRLHEEFRTDANGKGLWSQPLGGSTLWLQLLSPEQFDLNTSNRRALIVQYHLQN